MYAPFVAAFCSILDAAQQADAQHEAAPAADAFRYATAATRPQGVVIDVEAREVPEPRLIGYDLSTEK